MGQIHRRLILPYTLMKGDKGKNVGFAKIEKPERSVPYPRSGRGKVYVGEPGYRRLSDVHRRRKAFKARCFYPRGGAGEFQPLWSRWTMVCLTGMD